MRYLSALPLVVMLSGCGQDVEQGSGKAGVLDGASQASEMRTSETGPLVGSLTARLKGSPRVLDLGTLGYSTMSRDITGSGDVVGYSQLAQDGPYHAFIWSESRGIVDLGTLGGTASFAYAANAHGQVVGGAMLPGNTAYHAFVWTRHGGMVDLSTLGGTGSEAADISVDGAVVGNSQFMGDQPYSSHAFLWTKPNGMTDLGTLGGSYSYAIAVNARGEVIGDSLPADAALDDEYRGIRHAFMWSKKDGMTDLGTLGGFESRAYALSDSGHVVGHTDAAPGYRKATHAFLWTKTGGMTDLGTLGGRHSAAWAVNASGRVVGVSHTANGEQHAFLWTKTTGMVDLGTLGGTESSANQISASGTVVGSSTLQDGSSRQFIWTEQSGMLALGTSGSDVLLNDRGDVVVSTPESRDGTHPARSYLLEFRGMGAHGLPWCGPPESLAHR